MLRRHLESTRKRVAAEEEAERDMARPKNNAGQVNGEPGAGSLDRVRHILAKLKESLKCAICLKTLKNPKKGNCGHIFCETCILTHISTETSGISKGKTKTPQCPLCKRNMTKRSLVKESEQLDDVILAVKGIVLHFEKTTGTSLLSPDEQVIFSATGSNGVLGAALEAKSPVGKKRKSLQEEEVVVLPKKAKPAKASRLSLESDSEDEREAFVEDIKKRIKGDNVFKFRADSEEEKQTDSDFEPVKKQPQKKPRKLSKPRGSAKKPAKPKAKPKTPSSPSVKPKIKRLSKPKAKVTPKPQSTPGISSQEEIVSPVGSSRRLLPLVSPSRRKFEPPSMLTGSRGSSNERPVISGYATSTPFVGKKVPMPTTTITPVRDLGSGSDGKSKATVTSKLSLGPAVGDLMRSRSKSGDSSEEEYLATGGPKIRNKSAENTENKSEKEDPIPLTSKSPNKTYSRLNKLMPEDSKRTQSRGELLFDKVIKSPAKVVSTSVGCVQTDGHAVKSQIQQTDGTNDSDIYSRLSTLFDCLCGTRGVEGSITIEGVGRFEIKLRTPEVEPKDAEADAKDTEDDAYPCSQVVSIHIDKYIQTDENPEPVDSTSQTEFVEEEKAPVPVRVDEEMQTDEEDYVIRHSVDKGTETVVYSLDDSVHAGVQTEVDHFVQVESEAKKPSKKDKKAVIPSVVDTGAVSGDPTVDLKADLSTDLTTDPTADHGEDQFDEDDDDDLAALDMYDQQCTLPYTSKAHLGAGEENTSRRKGDSDLMVNDTEDAGSDLFSSDSFIGKKKKKAQAIDDLDDTPDPDFVPESDPEC